MAGSSGVFAHEGGERAYPLPWLLQEGEKKMPQSRFCLQPCSKPRVKPNGATAFSLVQSRETFLRWLHLTTESLPIEYLRSRRPAFLQRAAPAKGQQALKKRRVRGRNTVFSLSVGADGEGPRPRGRSFQVHNVEQGCLGLSATPPPLHPAPFAQIPLPRAGEHWRGLDCAG